MDMYYCDQRVRLGTTRDGIRQIEGWRFYSKELNYIHLQNLIVRVKHTHTHAYIPDAVQLHHF